MAYINSKKSQQLSSLRPENLCRFHPRSFVHLICLLLLAALSIEASVLHINKLSIPTLEPLRPSSTYVLEYGPLYSPNSSEPESSFVYTTPPALLGDMPVIYADLPPLPVKLALTKYVVSIAPSPKLYPRKNYFVVSSPNAPKTVAVDRMSTTQAQVRWTASNLTMSTSAAIAAADDAGTAGTNLENRIVYSVSFRQLPVDPIPGVAYKALSPIPINEIVTLDDTYQLQTMAKDLLPGAAYLANVSAVLLSADRLRIVSEPASVVWAMQPEPPGNLRENALRTNESSVTVTWKPPAISSLVSYYLVKITGTNNFQRTAHVSVLTPFDDFYGGSATAPGFKSGSNNNPISGISPNQQALSYTFDDLQPGTTYNISVQTAVERKSMPGASVQLSTVVVTQVTTVPEPPASITRVITRGNKNDSSRINKIAVGDGNALTLQWSPPRSGNADGYVVNVRPPLTSSQSVSVDQLGRTARILGIQPGAVYRVDVQSHSGPQLKQRFSKPLSQTIASGPAPPESVWFIPGATTPTSATIAWTASRGNSIKDASAIGSENAADSNAVLMPVIDYYEVRVNNTPSDAVPTGWKTTIVRSGGDGGAQTALVSDLLPAHTYQVEVVAVSRASAPGEAADTEQQIDKNEAGKESNLEKSLPTSILIRTKPLKPQELAVETLNITSVRLSWRAEVDSVHGGPRRDILYQISVARAASPQNTISSYRYQPRALAAGSRASVNLSPLESSTQYVFEVRTIYADDLISEPVTIEGGPALNMDVQLLVSNRLPAAAAGNAAVTSLTVQQPYVTLVIKKLPAGIIGKSGDVSVGEQVNDVPFVVDYTSADTGEHGVINITRAPLTSTRDGGFFADGKTKNHPQKDARGDLSLAADFGINGSTQILPSAVIGPLIPGASYKFRVRNVLTDKILYTAEEVMLPTAPLQLQSDFDETLKNGTSTAVLSWQAATSPRLRTGHQGEDAGVFDRFYLLYGTRDLPVEQMVGEYIAKTSRTAANGVEASTRTSATSEESAASTLGTTNGGIASNSPSQYEKHLTNLHPGTTYNVRVYAETRGRRSATFAELVFTTSPMPPERLRLVAVESEKIVVEWKAPGSGDENISHYILEVVNLNFSVSVAPQQQQQQQSQQMNDEDGNTNADGGRPHAYTPAPLVMAGMPPVRQVGKRNNNRPLGRSSSIDLPLLFLSKQFGSEPTSATSVAAAGSLLHNFSRKQRFTDMKMFGNSSSNFLRVRRSYLTSRFASAVTHGPATVGQQQQLEQDDNNGLDMPLRSSFGSGDFVPPRFPPGFSERKARVTGGSTSGGARTLIPLSGFGGSGSKLSHGQSKRQERWNVSAGSISSGGGGGVYQRTLPIMPGSTLCCKGAVYLFSIKSVVGHGNAEKESEPVTLTVQSLPPSVTVPQSNVQVLNTTAVEVHFKLTYPPQLSLFDAVEFRLNSSSSAVPASSQNLPPLLSRVFTFATQLMSEPQRSQYKALENPVMLVGLVPGETYSLDGWTLAGSANADAVVRSPVSTSVTGITLKPAPVSNLIVTQRSPTSVTVAWEQPVIFSIYHYYELVCNGTPSVVTLPKSRRTYDIVGLQPWTKYSVTVVAVSIANGGAAGANALGADFVNGGEDKVAAAALLGERASGVSQDERIVAGVMSAAAGIGGQRSEPTTIFVQTAETAPGPLRSVNSRLLGPRQLQLEWAAPDAPNGDLQYYAVEYRGTQHDAARRKKLFNASTTHEIVLEDLEPGEPYQIELYATTRAGPGDTFVVNVAPMPVWNPPLTHIAGESRPRALNLGTNTVDVSFGQNMFNETYGDVVAYTIIVTELASGDAGANDVEHRQQALHDADGVVPSWLEVHNLSVWPTYQATAPFNPFRSFDPAAAVSADNSLTARATASSNATIARDFMRQKRAVRPNTADDVSGVPPDVFNNQTFNNDAVTKRRSSTSNNNITRFVVGSDSSCVLATSLAAMAAQQHTKIKRDVTTAAMRKKRAATDSDAAAVSAITKSKDTAFSPRLATPPNIVKEIRRRNDRSTVGGNYLGGTFRDRQQHLHALDAVAVVRDDDEFMLGGNSDVAMVRPTQLLRQARLNSALIHSNDSLDLLPPSVLFGAGGFSNSNMMLKARLSDGIAPLFTGGSADGVPNAPVVVADLPSNVPVSPSGTEFCNGPLKPNTQYAVRVRAYTSLQPPLKYTDSEPLIISTLPVNSPSNYLLTVLLPVAVAIALVVLLVALVLFIRHRHVGPCFVVKRTRRAQARAIDDKLSMTESLQDRSRPVSVEQFPEHVRLMSADSDFRFSEEYDELKTVGKEQPSSAADLSCNRPKNRFTNILPYDHSRVKLQPTDDEEGTDYINASFMPGYNSPREFIVAQGPLHSTRDDFWRMIWEQNSQVIVMLTRCIEKGREKCDHYWPYDTEPVMYGEIQVTILNEFQTPDWTIREFSVCHSDQVRSIRHFHFTAWPDFGVPEHSQVLVQFIRAFRERVPDDVHPLVCHCSAGVGRSGTFIVLDRILQQLDKAKRVRASMLTEAAQAKEENGGSFPAPSYGTLNRVGRDAGNIFGPGCNIDIYGIVYEMRRERCSMVQTEQQYVYIHHCVLCVLEGREDIIDDHDDYGNSNAAKFDSTNHMMMTAAATRKDNQRHHNSLRYPAAMNVPGYHQSLPRGFNNGAVYNHQPHSTLQHQQSNNSYYENRHAASNMQQFADSPSSSRQRYYTQQGRNSNSSTLPYNHRLAGPTSAAYAGSVGNVAALLQQRQEQQQQHRLAGAVPLNLGGAGGGGVAADNMGYDDDEGIAESGPF